MAAIKINLVNKDGKRTSTTINDRVAETYARASRLRSGDSDGLEDINYYVQALAIKGFEDIAPPHDQAELYDAMMNIIERCFKK